ncbi:unnamed protein product [Orchesella dallaii]|uniref:Peptidase M1 leukotriene A4 hydrolase/aminopeptidase C-terminal domain-containing protein n=1 Tax=Orchesella dallaii TaxID=48710 RepID=A0ABP1PLB7_9HEXA
MEQHKRLLLAISLTTVYSFIIPLISSRSVLSGPSVSSIINTSNISEARFLCEAGVFEKDFSSQINTSFQSSGKSWCSRLAPKKFATMGKDKWLGSVDPSSFSNPEDLLTDSIALRWKVNFDSKTISGAAVYDLIVLNPEATNLILDTRDIEVSKVSSVPDGKDLSFTVGKTVSSFGESLTINVAELVKATGLNKTLKVEIQYTTSHKCTALQWLDPLQTSGKKHPYAFSQCQAIHARSLLPCQDTPYVKAKYTAEVSVPKELQALMSAVLVGEPTVDGNNKVYRFEQKIPIPSYLTAIAVGDIVGKSVGPRSTVWAERDVVEAAAYEFAETESMLKAAENIYGKYVWGVYDILVLPPSFPYGGMENPCLTFATPTLLAGDRSLANVIAHEIAHSWTGNLVTNNNWEHFWLNEGFTVFAERKILAALYGEKFRQFAFIGGWDELAEHVKEVKQDNPLTRLVVDLNGIDPDDAFSKVPYEKGSAFLYYLEQKVGTSVFEPFLYQYIQDNAYKSINSDLFKSQFITYMKSKGVADKIADVDWDRWFYTPGLPPVKNEYDTTLREACTKLKDRMFQWDPSTRIPFQKSDFDTLLPAQMEQFLQELIDDEKPLPLLKLQAMEKLFDMNARKSSEIRFRWIRLCIKGGWKDVLPLALKFVNEQGRMKFVRPIYRALYAWEDVGRQAAIDNFKENSKYMMHVSAKMVALDLKLRD